MRAPRAGRNALLTMALLAPAIGPAGAGSAGETMTGMFDTTRAQWTQARLGASKFFMSLDVDITLNMVRGATVAESLESRPALSGLAAPAETMSMRYFSDGLGRTSRVEMLLDPANGAMLQRSTHDTGNRYRLRVYRYGENQVLRLTRRPGKGEETRAPENWSRFSEELHTYPEGRSGLPVTEPAALIYLVAASGLRETGDQFSITAWSDDRLYTVSVRMMGTEAVQHQYKVTGNGRTSRQKGRSDALRFAIDGDLVGPPGNDDDDEAFELLGLTNVELFLDPDTRAPILLSGRLPGFGRVEFELEELTLATVSAEDPETTG